MSGWRGELQLEGRRALLLGLGSRQGGLGVARYLVEQGARVRVTDQRAEHELRESLAALRDLPIEYTLGRHEDADIRWADVIVRNPAVPRESEWLLLARDLDKPIEMEMTLFFRACQGAIAGVTGTKGKTTVTTLLAAMLRQGRPHAVLAGNMGVSALSQLNAISRGTPVAIELSSFQLEGLDERRMSPPVAVLTNLSPDHLDRYPSFGEYARTKAAIFAHQRPNDWAIVEDGALPESIEGTIAGRRATFGTRRSPDAGHALWVENGRFCGRWDGAPVDLGPAAGLRVPGEHSRLNALAAAAAALAMGATAGDIQRAIAGFGGVPHRLERVAMIAGVEYVNDTAATAPAAAIAALRAFAGREIVAIAGGSEKKLSLEPLAGALVASASAVVLLEGGATPALERLLRERGHRSIAGPFGSMEAAVARASELARPGALVLLSPGTASFGMFRDEFHRGEAFRAAVGALERACAT
ncbi:MAG TPA: UDP-N-acetylmuramoyl-L-alanine--D-glutamate ligase [Thermomicrobiales bacterium]|nr:UDP-N-acetylmuramoyl-L-alanine--D-glutamate ligase [Thermomicrobiales bacterium]